MWTGREGMWYAVWGFAHTGSECGILGEYATREEAEAEVVRFLAANDNPACGAWVRET